MSLYKYVVCIREWSSADRLQILYKSLLRGGCSDEGCCYDRLSDIRVRTEYLMYSGALVQVGHRKALDTRKLSLPSCTSVGMEQQESASVRAVRARDEHIHEQWVRTMEARLVRDKLQECQRVEGVNYHENCRQLSEQYLTMLKENKVKGYKHVDVA